MGAGRNNWPLGQEAFTRCHFFIIITSCYNAHKILALFLIPQKHGLDFRAKTFNPMGHVMPIRKRHQGSFVRVTWEAKLALYGHHSSKALLAMSNTTPAIT